MPPFIRSQVAQAARLCCLSWGNIKPLNRYLFELDMFRQAGL